MKKFTITLCSAFVLLAGHPLSAQAASSADLKDQISQTEERMDAAHQLAEAARTLGADEDHYCIWYAQNIWKQSYASLQQLTAAYDQAVAAEKEEQEKGTLLGSFRVSFYCPCAVCNGSSSAVTASGAPLQPGVSIAVDPSIIPLGSKVYIEGFGWRTAQDTGGAIKGNRIDICVSSHAEAYRLGVQYCNVYVK